MKKVTIQLTEEQVLALRSALRWYQSALGDQWNGHQTADPKLLREKLVRAGALFKIQK